MIFSVFDVLVTAFSRKRMYKLQFCTFIFIIIDIFFGYNICIWCYLPRMLLRHKGLIHIGHIVCDLKSFANSVTCDLSPYLYAARRSRTSRYVVTRDDSR